MGFDHCDDRRLVKNSIHQRLDSPKKCASVHSEPSAAWGWVFSRFAVFCVVFGTLPEEDRVQAQYDYEQHDLCLRSIDDPRCEFDEPHVNDCWSGRSLRCHG
jgi:hypothetical protein